jgi:hypothetical protein
MMTPDYMASAISLAFQRCCNRKGLDAETLASMVNCEVSIIDLIFASDFDTCFALRENYLDRGSVQRQLCDLIGLTPRICPEIDVDKIF